MKNFKNKRTGLLTIMLSMSMIYLFSCKKKDIPPQEGEDTLPECIENKIKKIDEENVFQSIKQYTFQGKFVYLLTPTLCWIGVDATSEVIDENCRTLGNLGGMAGLKEINGEDFSHAIYIRTIWEKPKPTGDKCKLIPDKGTCKAAFIKYFYNPITKKCEEFIWGGCAGVVPFNTLMECRNECGCN